MTEEEKRHRKIIDNSTGHIGTCEGCRIAALQLMSLASSEARSRAMEEAAKIAEELSSTFVAFTFDPDGRKFIGDERAKQIAQAIRNRKDGEAHRTPGETATTTGPNIAPPPASDELGSEATINSYGDVYGESNVILSGDAEDRRERQMPGVEWRRDGLSTKCYIGSLFIGSVAQDSRGNSFALPHERISPATCPHCDQPHWHHNGCPMSPERMKAAQRALLNVIDNKRNRETEMG